MDSTSTNLDNTPASGQPDHDECIKLLQLVLDNEATQQEKHTFEQHVCNCMPYFQIYEVDKMIKSMVKEACCDTNAPSDLAHAIKSRILQEADS